MALTLPAFDQYQQPLVPLRGLWDALPREGNRFVNIDILWKITTKQTAVQFSLSGNSPVAMTQIVAMAVDNSRSGVPVFFIFPDSGFVLAVPAHEQLVAPVFTNALMFYCSAPGAAAGDQTAAQIFNSMPPPITIAPADVSNVGQIAALGLGANGTVQLVPVAVSGSINTIALVVTIVTAGTGQLTIKNGAGETLWVWSLDTAPAGVWPITIPGLNIRFAGGLTANFAGVGMAGRATFNVYYSTP